VRKMVISTGAMTAKRVIEQRRNLIYSFTEQGQSRVWHVRIHLLCAHA